MSHIHVFRKSINLGWPSPQRSEWQTKSGRRLERIVEAQKKARTDARRPIDQEAEAQRQARNAEHERRRQAAIERDYQAVMSKYAQMDAWPCVMVKGTSIYEGIEPVAVYSKPDVDAATGGHLVVSFPMRVRGERGDWVHLYGSVNGKLRVGGIRRAIIQNYENVGWFPSYRFESVSKDLCNKPQ